MSDPLEEIEFSDFVLAELGRFIVHYSYAETLVAQIVAHLTGAEPALFSLITNDVSASTQADWLRALVELHPFTAVDRERMLVTIDELDTLRAMRNACVHGMWDRTSVDGTWTVRTIKVNRREMIHDLLITADDLKQATEDVRGLVGELNFYRHRIANHVPRP